MTDAIAIRLNGLPIVREVSACMRVGDSPGPAVREAAEGDGASGINGY
jgi:hypothetical protein